MSLNPIGLIVTAVAALVAGIIVLWNTNEGFRNAVIGAWDAIKAAGEVVWGWLVKFFTEDIPNAFNGMIDWFQQLPTKISAFFTEIIDGIKQWGIDAVNWVKTEVPKIIQGIFDFFNELPGKIGYALGFAIGTLIKWGVDAVKWVIEEVPKIIQGIIKFFTELPGKIATTLTNAIAELKRWGTNIVSWIATEVPKFISSIVTFFAELPGKIATKLSEVLGKIKGWVSEAVTTAKTEVPKIINNITSFFEELPDKMLAIGKNVVTGLWDGIKSMTDWIGKKVSSFATGVIDGFKNAFDTHSPSRVMRDEVGKMIGAGMAEGITDSTRQVNKAMQRINSEVIGRPESTPTGSVNRPSSDSISHTYNFEGMMSGANFIVRTDSDIPAIAKEVASVLSSDKVRIARGMGVATVGG